MPFLHVQYPNLRCQGAPNLSIHTMLTQGVVNPAVVGADQGSLIRIILAHTGLPLTAAVGPVVLQLIAAALQERGLSTRRLA